MYIKCVHKGCDAYGGCHPCFVANEQKSNYKYVIVFIDTVIFFILNS